VLAYRSDIDGLRSIAVGTVVLYHAFPRLIAGGFIGVDVFFVISGFLITSIIHRQAQAGTFSLAQFYERRARRILPALAVLLVAVIGLALLASPPSDVREMAKGLAGAATFTSNIIFWKETGYFGADAHEIPLLHTWSLAVEEQFYLIWPLLMVFIDRRRPLAWILAAAALSLGFSVMDVAGHPASAFYLPHDRMWELLAGAGLVFLPRWTLGPRAAAIIALAALAGILGPALFYTAQTPFPGIAAVPVCLGTAMLLHLGASRRTPVHRLLSARPFVAVGRISYSLYLWHWPVLVYARLILDRPPTLAETVAAVLAALALSALSWKFVENPARAFAASTRTVLVAAAGVLLLFALAGVGLFVSHGLPGRAAAEVLRTEAGLKDMNPARDRCVGSSGTRRPKDGCRFGPGPVRWTIWGDSHADAITPGFVGAPGAGTVREMAKHSCTPVLDPRNAPETAACRAFNHAALEELARDRPENLVIAARWGILFQGGFAQFLDGTKPPSPAAVDILSQDVARTLKAARTAVGPDARIILLGPIPEAPFTVAKCRARAQFLGRDADRACPSISRADFDRWAGPVDGALRRAAAEAGASYMPPAAYLCDARACPLTIDGAPRYFDDDHLSAKGARMLAGRAFPELAAPR
jgi:peptidoglycan/LPS O-acetylase OafA/YrhL